MAQKKKVVVIGGGAAGFFFAANAAELYPDSEITILEQGKEVLQKVKISGGGRCNVTHNCFDPRELVKNYPRGEKELLGPFYGFNPEHTIQWFNWHGVEIKAEEDGRMFPVSDSSQTIIDCLVDTCQTNGVVISKSTKVLNITPIENGSAFLLKLNNAKEIIADKLLVAPGSSNKIWRQLENLGLEIVPPVPSLFTFIIQDDRIRDLPGISIPNAKIRLIDSPFETSGPLLITHKGLSGPAILKLSAIGAIFFHEKQYRGQIEIDFLPGLTLEDLKDLRQTQGKLQISNHKLFDLPKRLYQNLVAHTSLPENAKWASLSNDAIQEVYEALTRATFRIIGQNRFKDEFVTAGGVELKEINFTNFSAKKYPNMHLAGEVLNIDAVTGGFNFQAAWTGAFLAAQGLFDKS